MAGKLKVVSQFLLKALIRVLIITIAALVITYIVSRKVDTEFPRLLEYAGFILMSIGALSVFGGQKITRDTQYNLTRMKIGIDTYSKEYLERTLGSYKFMIHMGLSAVILLFIAMKLY